MAEFAKVNVRVKFHGFSRHENFASDENRRRRESQWRIYKLSPHTHTHVRDPFPRECGRKFFADRSAALVSIRPVSVTQILPPNIRCWTRLRDVMLLCATNAAKSFEFPAYQCRGYFRDILPSDLAFFSRKVRGARVFSRQNPARRVSRIIQSLTHPPK